MTAEFEALIRSIEISLSILNGQQNHFIEIFLMR